MMKRKYFKTTVRVIATLAVAVTSSGCAMKGDIRQIQEDMRAMAIRQDSLLAELRAETLQTQDTLRTQTDQIFDFRGDIARRLQQIDQRLARIEALAGENQRSMASIRDQLANLRRSPIAAGPTTPVTGPTGGTTGGGESLVGGAGDPDDLWTVAQEGMSRGSLTSAARAFEEFLEQHPGDERAPDAHFFLADILEQQDRPEDALAAFQEVQALYPTAARVPDALYRIALLQEQTGDLDAARATLERIMNTYPDELVAMLARDKLAEIG